MYESRPGVKLYYYYDSYGNLSAIRYVLPDGENGADGTNKIYYVTTNAQGDVLGIYTAAGVQVAAYEYDAWGNCTVYDVTQDSDGNNVFTEVTYSDSQKFNMEFLNPFRYRGYYYDQDMEMYYLQSRYYDSQIGRFISADDTEVLTNEQESLLQFNLFAYCWNNPVTLADLNGESPANIIGAIVGGVSGAALGYLLAKHLKLSGWKKAALISAAAVGGAALGAFLGPYVAKLGGKLAAKLGVKSTIKSTIKSGKSLCFVAGTLVLTKDKKIPIECIKVGDYVYSENPETGQCELKKVIKTFVNETTELIHVYINEESIVTTPGHPFYVLNKGWVGADELQQGDKVILYGKKIAIVEKIVFEHLSVPVKVYNFEVEGFHTYYVGETSVLVHNKGCGLTKLSDSFLKKKLKLNAHAIKQEYLGKKAKIALYDLAVDKKTGIIYIVDKAGKIIEETIYKSK